MLPRVLAEVAGPYEAPENPPFCHTLTWQLEKPWKELTRSFQPDGIVPSSQSSSADVSQGPAAVISRYPLAVLRFGASYSLASRYDDVATARTANASHEYAPV